MTGQMTGQTTGPGWPDHPIDRPVAGRGATSRRVTARPLAALTDRTLTWARPAGPPVTAQSMLPGTGRPMLADVSDPGRPDPDWRESGTLLPDGLDDLVGPEPEEPDRPQVDAAPDGLPDPESWSRWLAQLMVEVVHGRRPAGQLARWTDERVLATVVLRTRQLRHDRQRPRPGSAGAPAVAASARDSSGIGALRVQRPSRAAVEASAVIRGQRSSALAFRLEAQGDRWVCTDIDFGPQTPRPS